MIKVYTQDITHEDGQLKASRDLSKLQQEGFIILTSDIQSDSRQKLTVILLKDDDKLTH